VDIEMGGEEVTEANGESAQKVEGENGGPIQEEEEEEEPPVRVTYIDHL